MVEPLVAQHAKHLLDRLLFSIKEAVTRRGTH